MSAVLNVAAKDEGRKIKSEELGLERDFAGQVHTTALFSTQVENKLSHELIFGRRAAILLAGHLIPGKKRASCLPCSNNVTP